MLPEVRELTLSPDKRKAFLKLGLLQRNSTKPIYEWLGSIAFGSLALGKQLSPFVRQYKT
jgi:hypothetical protein